MSQTPTARRSPVVRGVEAEHESHAAVAFGAVVTMCAPLASPWTQVVAIERPPTKSKKASYSSSPPHGWCVPRF